MDGWMNGWKNGWMDGWMQGSNLTVALSPHVTKNDDGQLKIHSK